MKKVFLLCTLALSVHSLSAQKKAVDSIAYQSWQRIGTNKISYNGNWALYKTAFQDAEKESKPETFIVNTKSGKKLTLEKIGDKQYNVNPYNLLSADYRLWDPSKCYLDYNNDGRLDMFAFLTNFKDSPYASKNGKFLLVNDVLGDNPQKTYSDANVKFLPRLRTIDINKDGKWYFSKLVSHLEKKGQLTDVQKEKLLNGLNNDEDNMMTEESRKRTLFQMLSDNGYTQVRYYETLKLFMQNPDETMKTEITTKIYCKIPRYKVQ